MYEVQKVSESAGVLDLLQSGVRAVLLIIGAVPLLIKLIGMHDFLGLVAYFRSADGAALTAAVLALVAVGQGLYKAFKRGKQVVSAVPYTPHLELK